jgi:hypothetical protein
MTDLTVTAALDHLDSWKLALRAENKAPGTIVVYADCTTRYLRWCNETDRLPMSRTSLNQWVAWPARWRQRTRHRPHPPTSRAPLRQLAHRRRRDPD